MCENMLRDTFLNSDQWTAYMADVHFIWDEDLNWWAGQYEKRQPFKDFGPKPCKNLRCEDVQKQICILGKFWSTWLIYSFYPNNSLTIAFLLIEGWVQIY